MLFDKILVNMLIPRVRPNYTLNDLFRGLFISDKSCSWRTALEDKIADVYNTKNVLLTSSGRASLYWILKALPQKKVIIPGYTCMVVAEAALLAGKYVSYVPTDYYTFNSDDFGDNINSDTIVIATHQYGLPCNIERIVKKCHEKGAVVIEDCAAALGTTIHGRQVGTFGDYAIFSFDPSKMITTPPKGGFLIAKDSEHFAQIRDIYHVRKQNAAYKLNSIAEGVIYCMLKNKILYSIFHYFTMGRKGKMQLSEHSEPCLELTDFYRYGFYEWQAYIAFRQFEKLNLILQKRKEVFAYYDKHIDNPNVMKPKMDHNAACIRYTIKVKDKYRAYKKFVDEGVDVGFSFNHVASPKTMTNEHKMSEEIMNLPYYYDISQKEMDTVVRVVNNL